MSKLKTYEDFANEAAQYTNIILRYQQTGEVYVDPDFHPQGNIKEFRYKFNARTHQWKRIDEYFKAPLFKHELINSNFIQQGELGDCYFLSALSRIARQPDLVRELFDDQPNDILGEEEDSINIKCGAVVIYFHAFGRKTPVLIDTQIPFKRGTRTPRFSHPTDLKVSPWFCLVEKAYAKLNGSYESIDGGTFPSAIYSLFGYFPDLKWISLLKDPTKMRKMSPFDRIMKYQRKGSVMGAAIHKPYLPSGVTEETILDLGLVLGHSYVLMKARTEENKNFICLRNPWGGHEWLGDWSDTSDLWTEELKQKLGMEESEDGSFWMNDSDFFYYFTKIDIARPIPPEFHSRGYCVQLTPGPHDGQRVSSKEADVGNRTNFAFQITEPIRKGEKCKVYIVIERRHQVIDEKTQAHINPTQFCALVLNARGQKLTPDVYSHNGDGRLLSADTDLFGFTIRVVANRHIHTIFIQRTQKSNYTENCYVQLFCKYDFKLYDIDYPDYLIPETENEGVMFDNNTVLHPNIAFPLMRMKKGARVVRTFNKDMQDISPEPDNSKSPMSEPTSEPKSSPALNPVPTSDDSDFEEEEDIDVTQEELNRAKAKAEEEAKAKEKAEEDARKAMEEVERLQKLMKEMEDKIAEREKLLQEVKEKGDTDEGKQSQIEEEIELEKSLLATNRQNIKISKKKAKNLRQEARKKKDMYKEADIYSNFLFESIRPNKKMDAPKKKLKRLKSIKEMSFLESPEPVEPQSKKSISPSSFAYEDNDNNDNKPNKDASTISGDEEVDDVIQILTSSDDSDKEEPTPEVTKPTKNETQINKNKKKLRGLKGFIPKISPA